jgi:ATP-dependent DNA ligase
VIAPMLAKAIGDQVPDSPGLLYEPKWDGFRCIVFRDDGVVLQSRKEEDFSYLFPEVVSAAECLPPGTTLDGELVIVGEKGLEFDLLGNRIRPRSEAGGWKISSLSQATPAQYVVFDILRLGGEDVSQRPFAARRVLLEALTLPPGMHLTPITDDPGVAREWFSLFEGAGLDGVVCKPADAPYTPGKRIMLKVKHVRTADVVVAGWRPYKNTAPDGSEMVGALLLGLYDEEGRLHNVGAAGSFTRQNRMALAKELAAIEVGPDDDHPWAWGATQDGQRVPGMQSRWTGKKDMGFHPIQPILVAEVKYDHMQGDRFRHVASFVRWRPDREPASCTYEQLEQPVKFDVAAVLSGEVR